MAPRVRVLRRVVLHPDLATGQLDLDTVRRACDHVQAGDDVVVILRGRIGADPAAADLAGRCLADARTIQVEGAGPCVGMFAQTIRDAACREADAAS